MTIEFDGWLDDELQKGFASFTAAPLPAGAAYRSRRPALARQRFVARVATRTVVLVVVAAMGLMATSELAATVVTGTTDPQLWTRHIVNAIGDCTTQVVRGRGGIDSCVSAIVQHDGPRAPQRAFPRDGVQALPAPTPGASPGGRPDDGQKGRPTALPKGRQSDVPSGPPSDHGKRPKAQPTKP
jgi:hypothetical protein